MTLSIPEESSKVVKETIKKEIKRLKEKIQSLSEFLFTYEEKYGFSSIEFQKKYNNGDVGDDQVFFEWYADLKTLNRIKKRLSLLEKIKIDQ